MYSTKEQVADEFNGITFGPTTNPTAETVERWIEEADALINAKVGLRYRTPVTDPNDLIVLRQISILLVAARVRRRLNRVGPDNETAKQKTNDTWEQAIKQLNDISTGKANLSLTGLLSLAGGISSNAAVSAGYERDEMQFKKNVDQW